MAENNNNSFDAAIAMRDLKAYNGNDTFVLGRLYNAIQDIKIQNEQEKEAIFILLDNTDEMSDDRKARVVKIKEEMTKAYDAAEKKNTATKTVVTAQTKTEITEVKTTLLENLPIVQSYAQHINLGSALALIKAQKGSDLPAQLAAAKKAVQDSQIANSGISIAQTKTEISGYTFSRSQVGSRESEQRRNALRAIEAAKLLDFIDALAKDPNTERLLKSNIPADRILGKDAPLLDLIMDFNDDGVLESINSTDKSTLWNQFRGVFGFSTAMQGEFVGENQARKAMDKAKLDAVLKKYEIERKQDEPLQDFAKRARSTLLLRADMLGSTDMSVDADKSIYTSSKKNKDALVATTKLITELKESIREKVPSANISPEEVNDIANKMSANVLRWVTTVGIGAINMDTVLTKMGQAVVVGKGPGIENFLALDETVMVTILKAETLKLGASAGA